MKRGGGEGEEREECDLIHTGRCKNSTDECLLERDVLLARCQNGLQRQLVISTRCLDELSTIVQHPCVLCLKIHTSQLSSIIDTYFDASRTFSLFVCTMYMFTKEMYIYKVVYLPIINRWREMTTIIQSLPSLLMISSLQIWEFLKGIGGDIAEFHYTKNSESYLSANKRISGTQR